MAEISPTSLLFSLVYRSVVPSCRRGNRVHFAPSFGIGSNHYGNRVFSLFAKRSRNDIAFLASLLLLSGFEVHRAAMASRVDMVLTCFIVLAMLQLYRWWELGLKGIPIWAILFMSIATLTKGPVGIVLPCAVIGIFLLFQKVSVWKAFYKIIPIALLSCILPLLWYYAAYQQGGEAFLRLVMEENVDRFLGKMSYGSHEQPIIYYVYITLAGWLPWSLLVIMSLFTLKYKRPQGTVKLYWERFKDYITHMDKMRLFSLLSIVIIFVFYCIPKSKRSVYILPIYPFIAYFWQNTCSFYSNKDREYGEYFQFS